ncbi:MAG: AraC family transcriptional regulator [Microbacterium sp.]|uniref:helix-turn-helix transcriptional regulator n=1 Tax=Microbacterium sp. TaxID=51671 RepID=UPI002825D71B|nr:AraC family transcriptional regulator [Microbacterium sp.]MDR2322470.1 AraC family transcriptional regulator [Microbacterium sp.]
MQASFELDVDGGDAVALFSRLGWGLDEVPANLRAGGDLLIADDFSVARIWHTPCRYVWRPLSAEGPHRFRASLIVEGSGVSAAVDGPVPFGPGTLLIHDASTAVEILASTPTAAIHLSHRWSRILPSGAAADEVPPSLQPPEHYAALLTAMVNATFEQQDLEDVLGLDAWLAAIDSAASALLSAVLPAAQGDVRSLMEKAAALIAERYADPAFTSAQIAEHLGVSTSQVYRAFAAQGTTPRQMLQQARVRHAVALLPPLATPAEAAAVAIAAGFGSARALRKALREERSAS